MPISVVQEEKKMPTMQLFLCCVPVTPSINSETNLDMMDNEERQRNGRGSHSCSQ